jgi:ADP-ribose pyrophosphatase YjhB (NUDIX family)
MPASGYVRELRALVGARPLLLPSATVMASDGDGRVLLVRVPEFGTWALPGGGVDPGEHPREAAVRECLEETGLHVEITGLVGVFAGPLHRVQYANGDVVDYVMTTYQGRVTGGVARPQPGETDELRFVSRPEARSLPLVHWLAEVWDAYEAQRGGR